MRTVPGPRRISPSNSDETFGMPLRRLLWRMPDPVKSSISRILAPLRSAPPPHLPAIHYPKDIADVSAVRAFLEDTDIFGEAAAEGAAYLDHALERFRITLAIAPPISPGTPVLELGANPYFFTRLLLRRGLNLTCANWFGTGHPSTGTQTVRSPTSGERHVIEFDHFDIERSAFPYADDSFGVVFFCEILEHLALDPINALAEIHRVLTPGGWLVLSTPNPVRMENLHHMLAGRNVYEPMSGYGVNGRHNREYTVDELTGLLDELGFVVDRIFTGDVSPGAPKALPRVRGLESSHRGEYVFAVARAEGPDRWRYPAWLFQSRHALHRVVRPDVEVGVNDDLQTSGFHERERIGDAEYRWLGAAPVGRVTAVVTAGGTAKLSIRGLGAPSPAGEALTLTARSGDASASWAIPCDGRVFEVDAVFDLEPGQVTVELSTDRLWRPADVGVGRDLRLLGVAVSTVRLGP